MKIFKMIYNDFWVISIFFYSNLTRGPSFNKGFADDIAAVFAVVFILCGCEVYSETVKPNYDNAALIFCKVLFFKSCTFSFPSTFLKLSIKFLFRIVSSCLIAFSLIFSTILNFLLNRKKSQGAKV